MGRRKRGNAAGFTLVELLAVLVVVALLGLLAIPVLANGKSGSQRAVCVNNLSRIGRAHAIWGTDHGDYLPSQVLWQEGGTRFHPTGLNNNVWFQFDWVSNELATPKILACPSDPFVRVAGDFSATSPDAFWKPGYQNNAVSYILGWPYFEDGRLVLSGDRNIPAYFGGGYISGMNPVATIHLEDPTLSWLPGIHAEGGNLLFNDGSVEQVDDAGLRAAMRLYPRLDAPKRSVPMFQYPRFPYPPNL
jgi:prepilin-type N-terminal cleavage/methylation domain-containing protein/prepilin-type processing-associated H-X9-DG protein